MSEHNDRLRDKLPRATPDELRLVANKYNELLGRLAEFKHELEKVDLPYYPPPELWPKKRTPDPEWLLTHPDHSYELMMFESNDNNVEQISLSREDYIWLKRRLAERWGVDKAEIKRFLGGDEDESTAEPGCSESSIMKLGL